MKPRLNPLHLKYARHSALTLACDAQALMPPMSAIPCHAERLKEYQRGPFKVVEIRMHFTQHAPIKAKVVLRGGRITNVITT